MYRALRPFTIGNQHVGRGALVEDSIEASPNFDSLYRNGFIENADIDIKNKSEYVPNYYIVVSGFIDNARRWRPGDIVNGNNVNWRNIDSMLRSGYLRRATKKDLEGTGHNPVIPNEDNGAYAMLWKNEAWLREQYIDHHRTMAEIAQDAGCAISTLAKWMKKFGIERRKPGIGGKK